MSQFIAGFENGSSPSTVGGTGTAIKYFPFIPGPSIGVASTSTYQLAIPGANRLNGQSFTVTLCGEVSTDPLIACPSINVTLAAVTLPGTGSTSGMLANPIVLGTLGSTAAGNAFGDSFRMIFNLYGGNLSGIVGGTYTASLNGAATKASTVVDNKLSGINFGTQLSAAAALNVPSGPPFTLVAGVTFSVSGTNNKAFLYQFALES